jgi:hypothetical protein
MVHNHPGLGKETIDIKTKQLVKHQTQVYNLYLIHLLLSSVGLDFIGIPSILILYCLFTRRSS